MAIVKRWFLFALVNMLILVTLSLVFQVIVAVFGLRVGPDAMLWTYYGVIGMGGAIIQLLFSRQIAKWTMGVRVLDPNSHDPSERRLIEIIHNLARRARLPAMPQVGIYDRPEVNAFATGPTKSRSMVAVSTALLAQMDADAVEGVLGHEITHIANGDMVTMTLIQGVINTMVLIAARIVSSLIADQVDSRARGVVRFVVFIALQIIFSILGSMVVCYFSRAREYRADAGGARLAGRDKMLAGLKALRPVYGQVDEQSQAMATLKISGHSASMLAFLTSTHPPLEDRIRRLETTAL